MVTRGSVRLVRSLVDGSAWLEDLIGSAQVLDLLELGWRLGTRLGFCSRPGLTFRLEDRLGVRLGAQSALQLES